MKVKPIRDPVAGERVVGVSPPMSPTVRSEWHRRLNLYTGRTLSHRALLTEQEQRAGRLATRGQILSPGVVSGLEVDIERAGDTPDGDYITVQPGHGLAASGEDVWLPRPLRVAIGAMPVHGAALPPAPTAGVLVLEPVVADLDDELTADDLCEEDEQSYAYQDWQRVDGCRLVLYPWPAQGFAALPPFGPRWRNRIAYAIFDAERRTGRDDLLPWEEVGVPIALLGFGDAGAALFADRAVVVRAGGRPRRRSQLLTEAGHPALWQARIQQFAEQVAEQYDPAASPDEPAANVAALAAQFRYLPPVGLLPPEAIRARAQRDHFFPSTYHVTALPVPEEQLDLAVEASASLRPFDTFTPDQVQVLVPVPELWYEPGLLEIEQVDAEFAETIERFVARRARWLRRRDDLRQRAALLRQTVRGGPLLPLELDRADDELPATTSARLRGGLPPFDVSRNGTLMLEAQGQQYPIRFGQGSAADRTRMTIEELDALLRAVGAPVRATAEPVSGRLLLSTIATGDQAVLRVGQDDRGLFRGLGLTPTETRGTTDPTEPIDPDDPQLRTPEQSYGVESGSGRHPLVVQALEALRNDLRQRTPLRRETAVRINQPFDQIPPSYADRLRYDEGGLLIFSGRMTPQEHAELRRIDNDEVRQAIDQLFRNSQQDELSQLDQLGLEQFISLLQSKIDRANDTIDLGFLRVQTDIYRIRQSILGTSAASRLTTSPVLAGIAKGETAVATRESLSRFLEESRGRPVDTTSQPNQTPTLPPEILRAGNLSFVTRSVSADATPEPPTGETFAPETSSRNVGALRAGLTPDTADLTAGIDRVGLTAGIDLGSLIGPLTPIVTAPSKTPAPLISLQTAQLQPSLISSVQLLREPSKDDIIEQPPIVGKAYNFRTATIAERLEKSESLEAKAFTVASKYAVVNSLANLDLNLDDLQVPGFIENRDGRPVEVQKDFATIKAQGLAAQILQDLHDPDPPNGDEAAFFARGIKTIDHSVGIMRVIEGRIQAYKVALDLCWKTLRVITELIRQIDQRLAVVGGELAEARHDVAVARALLAEEERRVAAINQRRDTVIAEHVRYLVFQRPRSTDLRRPVPTRTIEPGAVASALPACLRRDVAVPPQLRAMVDLLREVPLGWFPQFQSLLDRLDRLPMLQGTLQSAKLRAQSRTPGGHSSTELLAASGTFGQAISNVFSAQQQLVSRQRSQTAQFDLARLSGQSWQLIRREAGGLVSLGDLIDADHGRSDVAQRSSAELDMIAQAATCLYSMFGAVLPVIRLDWAERLSQYDRPVDLRSLASLPRWGEIELLDRRAMQSLVDWLFQRIDPRQPQPVALLNDLIRVCVLLASHAPVNQIVSGRVARPTTVSAGSRVEIAVDLSKIRVGMNVLLYSGPRVIAQGVVEDLGAGKAAARVLQVTAAGSVSAAARPSVQLDQDAQVHFSDAAIFDPPRSSHR